MSNAKTVVFIHGMFMTPLCWEHWLPYAESKGYKALAPAWPGRQAPIEELRRRHPDQALGRLNLSAVVDHLSQVIGSLGDKPILIGHSMGGLITQILVNRGLAAAGIAIDSAPPVGVFTAAWSFLKANWPMINPLAPKYEPRLMPLADFKYAFVNNLPPDQQRTAYDRYVVPESRQVPQESLGGIGRIDFNRPHAPLLLIAGTQDHIIPASLNRSNYQKYKSSSSVTDFKEFAGRAHFIIGQPDWAEVAGYCFDWLAKQSL